VWPYVNGKALVNGLRLENMEASDMLDVLHYFFEESSNFSSAEQAKASDQLRVRLYKDLYNRNYKFATKSNSGGFTASGGMDFEAENDDPAPEKVEPFNPRHKEPTKAFVAATPVGDDDVNPFKGVLDAPIS
jgi:hypothetical protein